MIIPKFPQQMKDALKAEKTASQSTPSSYQPHANSEHSKNVRKLLQKTSVITKPKW